MLWLRTDEFPAKSPTRDHRKSVATDIDAEKARTGALELLKL